ncbi:MAG: hypothetical protein A2Z39_03345 [Deltaproteobacteria bacterium RBG_19FT_COMBO_46_9]|nr:MAG: hypothetical protein A2Z39_03345 [Deltaproteobacteria bacterium RBG_19FT_COMBO_46_9]
MICNQPHGPDSGPLAQTDIICFQFGISFIKNTMPYTNPLFFVAPGRALAQTMIENERAD